MSEHSFQPPDQTFEITRLRAEVERLKNAMRRSTDDFVKPTVEKLERERDEALAALNDAKKALKIMNQNLDDLARAKQEALAQVAVLLSALDRCEENGGAFSYYEPHDVRCPKFRADSSEKWKGLWICKCGREELDKAVADSLVEARALLDRLAMLEDGAMTNQRLVWLEDRLQRAEAVVESALSAFRQICTIASALEGDSSVFKRINDIASSQCVVLAAWEEGG